jgi:hypothetical protein
VRWDAFEQACPEIGSMARERFARDELVLVGTIRADGSPRISPTEPDFAAGELFLGMMWRSPKALDLLRDPRGVVHSVPSDRWNEGGDIKLYGTLDAIDDLDIRSVYREAIRARLDWAPEEPSFHLFALDLEHAAYKRFDEHTNETWTWSPGRGLERRTTPNVE